MKNRSKRDWNECIVENVILTKSEESIGHYVWEHTKGRPKANSICRAIEIQFWIQGKACFVNAYVDIQNNNREPAVKLCDTSIGFVLGNMLNWGANPAPIILVFPSLLYLATYDNSHRTASVCPQTRNRRERSLL